MAEEDRPEEQKHQPRQDDGPEREPQYSLRLRHVFVILILMAVFAALLILTPMAVERTEAPYTQFLEAMEEERVTEVVMTDEEVRWVEVVDGEEVEFEANRVPDVEEEDLLDQLHAQGVTVYGEHPSPWWHSPLVWLLPLLLVVFIWWRIISRGAGGMGQLQNFGQSQAQIVEEGSTGVTFDDVAGLDEVEEEIREVVHFLKHTEKYRRIGAEIPKGVILVGPPGTGKTLIARATAGEADVPFLSITGSDFVEMFAGVGAARTRDLFRQAREKAPCMVFIDEIDALGRRRSRAQAPMTNEEREQTLNQLLAEIDGFDSSVGVILMAATNRPDLLDKALLRPGRFDRQISVDKPDLDGREAILEVHARGVKLDPEVDLRTIAARTPGFAGAELANVMNEAALLAVRKGHEEVKMEDLDDAVDRVMAGLERKSRALIPRERRIIAHHEMGHAMMGMMLPYLDPVHKVSIVPRGSAALGATIQAPLEDRYLLTEPELRDRMTVVLGGRAAEQVVFGEISTGAADDLQRAAALARRMVTQFGMTHELGPIALEDFSEEEPGDGLQLNQRSYSEDTATKIDAEVRRVVDENYERAVSLLSEHKDALTSLADRLLEVEVMEGDELRERLEEFGISRLPRPDENEGDGRK